jgi:hypothetical protein
MSSFYADAQPSAPDQPTVANATPSIAKIAGIAKNCQDLREPVFNFGNYPILAILAIGPRAEC